ncbi:Ribosomal protein S6 kinase alpha-4 [Blattella germanica]|nr:Ribosomal protein S6 kinase alpha-4 [Blattella germanica]
MVDVLVSAFGTVTLVRKNGGTDDGSLYTMKVLEKERLTRNRSTIDHKMTERNVLVEVRNSPFLATLYYAFQTIAKLYLVLGFAIGGELFTHHYQRNRFQEPEVRFFVGEIILALETLHNVSI